VGVSLTGPVNAQRAQWGCTVCGDGPGVQRDCVDVCVCVSEGDVGRPDCGFVLLHSMFYIVYCIFYILYILHSINSGRFRVARGGSWVNPLAARPEVERVNEPRLGVGTQCL